MSNSALYKAMYENGANAQVINGHAYVGGFKISASTLQNLRGIGDRQIRDLYPNYTASAGDTIRRNASNLLNALQAEANREIQKKQNNAESESENQLENNLQNPPKFF